MVLLTGVASLVGCDDSSSEGRVKNQPSMEERKAAPPPSQSTEDAARDYRNN